MLTATDLTRLGAAADALLSPLVGPSPDAWRAGAAAALRDLFGTDHAVWMVLTPGERPRYHSDTMPAGVLRRFEATARGDAHGARVRSVDAVIDAWLHRRAAQGVEVYNEPFNDRMVGGRIGESTVVRDVMRPAGLYDFLGFATSCPGPSGGELMLFMGHERRGRSRFGPERELAVLRALLPAFRAGHHALARFGAQRAALGTVLDTTDDALVVVGPDGRAVHRTPALARLLAADPARERLEAALAAAGRAPAGAAGAGRDAEQRIATALGAYAVRAARLPAELLGEPGGVLVSIEPLRAEAPRRRALADAFGLTPREAEVAEALARRLTNAEIARALGVSARTADHHTERVLAKLGVRSRRDVAERLHGGAGGAGGAGASGAGTPAAAA